MGRAHVARGHPIVVALLDETYLLGLTLALKRDVIDQVDASIHEFLLWQEALEDELPIA
jgi:hypothetical protein